MAEDRTDKEKRVGIARYHARVAKSIRQRNDDPRYAKIAKLHDLIAKEYRAMAEELDE